MSKYTGGPAHPVTVAPSAQGRAVGEKEQVFTGLTVRDYFAVKFAAEHYAKTSQYHVIAGRPPELTTQNPSQLAEQAYLFADAMLAERSKP